MTGEAVQLGPVRGRARIEMLDILRGIAILGILFMNIPFMGANAAIFDADPRRLSWSSLDQGVWTAVEVLWSGTQRGLFEFLFGAGMLVLTARAMKPDDPVAVADLYYRRNMLLIAFGLADIFLVGWVGDILLAYGIAALVLFPFRKLAPRILIVMGLSWTLISAVGWGHGGGIVDTLGRREQLVEMPRLEARKAQGAKLSAEEKKKLEAWQKRKAALDLSKPLEGEAKQMADAEAKARAGSPLDFLANARSVWLMIFGNGHGLFFMVLEAVSAMFIGMALFKWGVLQGQRSARFYAGLALAGYVIGFSLRGWDAMQVMRFDLQPKIGWITYEFARLAVTAGHVGFFNLLARTNWGHTLLSPFRAAGRMAFSIYVGTSIVTLWFVFAPWGLGLWNRLGWAELMLAALVIDIVMLIAANLWLRRFACGPLEWAWRSLAYGRRQPFRLGAAPAPGDVAAAA